MTEYLYHLEVTKVKTVAYKRCPTTTVRMMLYHQPASLETPRQRSASNSSSQSSPRIIEPPDPSITRNPQCRKSQRESNDSSRPRSKSNVTHRPVLTTAYKPHPTEKMKAALWTGTKSIELGTVAKPTITAPKDAIVHITHCTICGSDLHMYVRSSRIRPSPYPASTLETNRSNPSQGTPAT